MHLKITSVCFLQDTYFFFLDPAIHLTLHGPLLQLRDFVLNLSLQHQNVEVLLFSFTYYSLAFL